MRPVSTGSLATVLRETSDDDLIRGLRLRRMTPAGIRDFFDLADELLGAASLQECLTRLDRTSLSALARLSGGAASFEELHSAVELSQSSLDRLRTQFLIHGANERLETWKEVSTQLQRWPELGLPDVADAASTVGADGAAEPLGETLSPEVRAATDRAASEHAFSATLALTELIHVIQREPVPLLANGTLGRPAIRSLAALTHVDDAVVRSLVDFGRVANLIASTDSLLVVTDAHAPWLRLGHAEQWATVAGAWMSRHCSDIRKQLSERFDTVYGDGLARWLDWNYPGGRDWLDEERHIRLRDSETLGVTSRHIISTPAALLLGRDENGARAFLAATLPSPVDKIYLQHDLTAVATAPLRPDLDARIRAMADADGNSIAARFRFTRESVMRAVSGHETASTMLEFLESIALAGVPQPLHYLISETATRHGLLRAGSLPPASTGTAEPSAVSYVRSEDPVLLRTVLVDRNLAGLALRPSGDGRLVSPRDRDQLYSVLRDARYPVAAEDTSGKLVEPGRTAPLRSRATGRAWQRVATSPIQDPLRSLLRTMRAAEASAPDDADEAWFARQLHAAIRSKATVTVSVRMPNGTVVDYRVEPASVAGGRLRARDPISEIERTFPLSSVSAITT